MIDPSKFNFPEIFGVIQATSSLKRNQTRPLRAEIQEIAIAKYSGNQLKYVGDTQVGMDFEGLEDNLRYESKGMDGLFQKRVPYTKEITLKNFQGKNLGIPDQTFDWMLLWDTSKNMVGICSWEACMKNIKIKDAVISFRVHINDIIILDKDVNPIDKPDIGSKLTQLIEQAI